MGVVVAAHHIQLDTRSRIKFLLARDASRTPEAVERFAARGARRGEDQSEHVARVLDVGTLETGAPYMVMEFLDGRDLADVARSSAAPLPSSEAVDYVLQACEAVAEAHSLGIVHRDLKPANLFCTRRPDGRSPSRCSTSGSRRSAAGRAARPARPR